MGYNSPVIGISSRICQYGVATPTLERAREVVAMVAVPMGNEVVSSMS